MTSRRWQMRLVLLTGRTFFRLAIGAATVLFAVLAALPLVDHKALIVTSGSMEPLLSAGDAAVIHTLDVEELSAGDVITYRGYGSEGLTTHRIVEPVDLPSGLHFQTKGDANVAPDPNLAPAEGVVGRYVVGLPGTGRFLLFLARPVGRLLIVGLPALTILAGELRFLLSRRSPVCLAGRPRLAFAVALIVAVPALAGGVLMASAAVMFDADTVSQNTFSTASTFAG